MSICASVGPRHAQWRGPHPRLFSILRSGRLKNRRFAMNLPEHHNIKIAFILLILHETHHASPSSLGLWPCKQSCKSERGSFSWTSLGISSHESSLSGICTETSNLSQYDALLYSSSLRRPEKAFQELIEIRKTSKIRSYTLKLYINQKRRPCTCGTSRPFFTREWNIMYCESASRTNLKGLHCKGWQTSRVPSTKDSTNRVNPSPQTARAAKPIYQDDRMGLIKLLAPC